MMSSCLILTCLCVLACSAHSMKDHKMNDTVNDDMGMSMSMSFHFRVQEVVLFADWKITTVTGMVASVIGIFIMGMLYEGLKYYREHLLKKYASSESVNQVQRHRMLSVAHAIQTGLHIIQVVVSYFLMLIFMTYNGWLCIAVVLGSGFGYFVFGWRKASVVDITEHCH